jgi:alpha-tubulin suppressor-like RCC1 family protein
VSRASDRPTGCRDLCSHRGAVKCWGHNTFGQLGDGTTPDSSVPVGVVGLGSGAVAVSTGEFHSCALTASCAVRCWGYNADGELGDGIIANSAVPAGVVGLGSGVAAVTAGGSHSCAVTASGAIKCWGRDAEGELGDGIEPTRQYRSTSPGVPRVKSLSPPEGFTPVPGLLLARSDAGR